MSCTTGTASSGAGKPSATATPRVTVPSTTPSPLPPGPTPAQVAAAVRTPLAAAALGPPAHVHAEVVDTLTEAVLLNRGASTPVAPASTVKLLTAAAALRTLGATTRLTTTVVTSAPLSAAGTLAGDVVLVGGGDPTLTAVAQPHDPRTASLGRLVAALRAAGVRRITGRLLGDGSLFTGATVDPGWSASYLSGGSVAAVTALQLDGGRYQPGLLPASRVAQPALYAAQALTVALQRAGIPVLGGAGAGPADPGARTLVSVEGLPVAQLVRQMLTYSDNDIAEALGRVAALRQGLPADATGAARAVAGVAAELGLPTVGLRVTDGSGLSRQDRVPLATLLGVLLRARGSAVRPGLPWLAPVLAGLPVAGRTGTLKDRFTAVATRSAAGRVRAKTGALLGVNTLVGFATDRGRRLLAFAVATDAVTVRSAAENALDATATALAALH